VKIKLARYAGFCMGVRRALRLCMDLVRSGKSPIYTLGPIIHNSTVIDKLDSFGVRSLKDIKEVTPQSHVLIRSHGITPKERGELVKRGINICDATCPKVAKVQAIIKSHVAQGYSIVIVGDHGHAETQGLLGYSDDKGVVLATMDEADGFIKKTDKSFKVCVVAQTTQEPRVFNEFCEKLKSHFKDIKIIDTICDATRKRQEEVNQDSLRYDCVIVAGGRHSANTTRLYETALKSGKRAFHIENSSELEKIDLEGCRTVLVTAGASTPLWIIHEIKEKLKSNKPSEYILQVLSSRWFAVLSFVSAFILSRLFFPGQDYWTVIGSFAASLMLVVGLYSLYMSELDMLEEKLAYTWPVMAGGFLTLGLISLLLKASLIPALLYYCLLFYVVYKNKALARRIVIAMLNISFWIILGGIWYGK